MNLWHYTCDHGHEQLGESGDLLPLNDLHPGTKVLPLGDIVWATDLDWPLRDALGLTSHMLNCDRARHRYSVDDPTSMVPYGRIRASLGPVARELEESPGAMPGHWYVAIWPVSVTHEPLGIENYSGAFGPLP